MNKLSLRSCSPQTGSTERLRSGRLYSTRDTRRRKRSRERERPAPPSNTTPCLGREGRHLGGEGRHKGGAEHSYKNELKRRFLPAQVAASLHPGPEEAEPCVCVSWSRRLAFAVHLRQTVSPFVKPAPAHGLGSGFAVKFKNRGGFFLVAARRGPPCFCSTGHTLRWCCCLLTVFTYHTHYNHTRGAYQRKSKSVNRDRFYTSFKRRQSLGALSGHFLQRWLTKNGEWVRGDVLSESSFVLYYLEKCHTLQQIHMASVGGNEWCVTSRHGRG